MKYEQTTPLPLKSVVINAICSIWNPYPLLRNFAYVQVRPKNIETTQEWGSGANISKIMIRGRLQNGCWS